MTSRSNARGLHELDIEELLVESEIDLTDEEDAEEEPIAHREDDYIVPDSGTSNGSDSEEDSRSQSEVSLRSSITSFRGRTRTRRGPRTRGGRSRGRVRTRGGSFMSVIPQNNTWQGNFSPLQLPVFEPRYNFISTRSWKDEDYFEPYLNDDILEKMVTSTNRTYLEKTGKNLKLSLKELKSFIGIMLVMSCINLPQIRMYWSNEYGILVIKNAMTRLRFFTLRSSLKVVFDSDVSQDEKVNKIWKVAPLFESVLRGCQSQPRDNNISIDEMIIPFSGHCGIRQYCPGKPNPVGIKVFVLANPNGLVCDMVVYQGDSTFPDLRSQGFTLGESVVLKLCEMLVPGHHLYFDRYFTTIKLIETLLKRGFHGTGTIQRNRIPRTCEFTNEQEFKKSSRGTSETLASMDGTIAVTRWLDNKPVLIASTFYASSSPDLCKRWSKREKRYEMVRRPEVIKHYNQYMGGVDMADRMLSVCPSRSRTKKWTIRFISHMVDLAACNAWFQFKDYQKQCRVPAKQIPKFREFKLRLGESMIIKNTTSSASETDSEYEELAPKHQNRRASIVPLPAPSLRWHKSDHLVKYSVVQKRCRKPKCSKPTTAYCIKCNIHLCSTKKRNCFLEFHQKEED